MKNCLLWPESVCIDFEWRASDTFHKLTAEKNQILFFVHFSSYFPLAWEEEWMSSIFALQIKGRKTERERGIARVRAVWWHPDMTDALDERALTLRRKQSARKKKKPNSIWATANSAKEKWKNNSGSCKASLLIIVCHLLLEINTRTHIRTGCTVQSCW